MDGRLQRVDLSSRNWWKSIIFVRDRFLTLKKISSKGKKKEKEKIVARLFLPLFILSIRSLGFSERATFQSCSLFLFSRKSGYPGCNRQPGRLIIPFSRNSSSSSTFPPLLLPNPSCPRPVSAWISRATIIHRCSSRTISGISSFRFSAISRSRIRIRMIFVEK